MILIDGNSPRWLRELNRFIHLKSLLLLHGNVLDLVSCQIQADEGRKYWTESNLSDFFKRLLPGMGYQVVGLFDPVDGLSFPVETMEQRYQELLQDESDASGARRGQTDNDLIDLAPIVRGMAKALANRSAPCAFVVNFASRLVSSPDRPGSREQALFTRILKASLEAREVIDADGSHNNVLILVCDKINDLPAFLYLNNPRSRSIHIESPGISERQRFMRSNYRSFHGAQIDAEAPGDLVNLFSALTDGFSYYEMLSLIGLSQRERIAVEQIRNLCERFKYGIVESDWDKLDRTRLAKARELIRGRIKGQDVALNHLLEIIKRAKLGMAAGSSRSQRPRGVLFFAGPTGVGKTEMAKGLAELLFGQDDRLIRFDMSEYAAAHADQKLLGAPPGYVGYEEGGKLTNAMKQQPFSVLLFDEVEKAHPSIFDKFLQILDDGRLTDGKGETVYFSECIIIFTSNIGTYTSPDLQDGSRQKLVSPEMPYPQVREVMLEAIRHHFNQVLGRPEILNRFGENFVVFDYIRPPLDQAILDHLLKQLIDGLKEQQRITLTLHVLARQKLISLAKGHLEFGGRGLRNLLEATLVNPLATQLFDVSPGPGDRVEVLQLHQTEDGRYQLDIQVTSNQGHEV